MHVEIKQLPALRVAAVGHLGPYHEIGKAFARLGEIAGNAGLIGPSAAAMVALYHDDPRSTPPEQLTSHAGVTFPADAPLPQGLEDLHVPAGTYACAVHVGSYELLGDAWARLTGEWLPASGRRRNDSAPSYEVYLSDMATTPKHELRTEIRIPLS